MKYFVIAMLVLNLLGQNKTDQKQNKNRPSIVAVEWATCTGPGSTTETSSCAGLEFYKFKLADGTIRGPFVAIPADPNEVAHPVVNRTLAAACMQVARRSICAARPGRYAIGQAAILQGFPSP